MSAIALGVGLGRMGPGRAGAPAPRPGTPDLAKPENLYSPGQSALTETQHVDLRNNWLITGGMLSQIPSNGSTNDVRLAVSPALGAGHAHVALWRHQPGAAGRYKPLFGGVGSHQGHTRYADEDVPQFHYVPAAEAAAFTRFGFNPLDDTMDALLGNIVVHDLVTTDPHQVACDVVLCLGDSNMSNSVSEFVTSGNLETVYDPRVWYMPCLRTGGSFGPTDSVRHVPLPCIEPVQASGGAKRMSPVMACAGELVGWSAGRGRPLLMLSLGDPGSGLNGSSEWDKSSTVASTGGLMYQEMLAMIAALQALGPAHEIIGAVVSLGANDGTAADYAEVWEPKAAEFVANLRADLSQPDLPLVWLTPGEHYEPVSGETRGARMIAAIERLDQDSGALVAIPRVHAVRPPVGHALGDATDPHFDAAGMQANGRLMGATLRTALSTLS